MAEVILMIKVAGNQPDASIAGLHKKAGLRPAKYISIAI